MLVLYDIACVTVVKCWCDDIVSYVLSSWNVKCWCLPVLMLNVSVWSENICVCLLFFYVLYVFFYFFLCSWERDDRCLVFVTTAYDRLWWWPTVRIFTNSNKKNNVDGVCRWFLPFPSSTHLLRAFYERASDWRECANWGREGMRCTSYMFFCTWHICILYSYCICFYISFLHFCIFACLLFFCSCFRVFVFSYFHIFVCFFCLFFLHISIFFLGRRSCQERLHNAGFFVDVETSNKTLNKKVREGVTAKFNYILVVGEAEEVWNVDAM